MFGVDDMLAATGLSVAGNIAQDAFSARQASIQRDFQERMLGSGFQRRAQDLSAAGLNPILAATQGPASVPMGGMAQGAIVDPVSSMQSWSAASLARAGARKANAEAGSAEVDYEFKKRALNAAGPEPAKPGVIQTLPQPFQAPASAAAAAMEGFNPGGFIYDLFTGKTERERNQAVWDMLRGGRSAAPTSAVGAERSFLPGGAAVGRSVPGQLNILKLKREAR